VVVSHDCDLAQSPEVEPHVEVIVGRKIATADGNFTHAKNPRRLHLLFKENALTTYLDLQAKEKTLVSKDDLIPHVPSNMRLSPSDRSVLQQWLAARYRRSAFPDEFIRRLQGTGTEKRIAKIIEPLGAHLIAVFFDVDEGEEVERKEPTDSYMLRIDLLYSTRDDPIAALKSAEDAARAISAAFRACYFSAGKGWHGIELLDCDVSSDEAMTYAMSTNLKKWNADYLSLRAQTDQPIHSD
jgi:hypothetical protein